MRVIAVVPVKVNSERVESKNFKPFADGRSLLELKLEHLIEAKCFDAIYVSSDSEQAEAIAKHYGVGFLPRDVNYCNNITPWSEVIHHVVTSIPEPEETHIAWCHTTSPLFSDYADAIAQYKRLDRSEHNGLMTVSRLVEFIVSERARPVNYDWGVWHPYSQDLQKLFAITGALFVAQKAEMLKNRYVISTRPYMYEVDAYSAIDIDTMYDFRLAQVMYANRSGLKES